MPPVDKTPYIHPVVNIIAVVVFWLAVLWFVGVFGDNKPNDYPEGYTCDARSGCW